MFYKSIKYAKKGHFTVVFLEVPVARINPNGFFISGLPASYYTFTGYLISLEV